MDIDGIKMQILMGKKNFNIAKLAEKSQVSRQTISCIKAGKSCTPIIACKIAEALDVDVTEILSIKN
ncbi:helix-turn-helix domain-containing protein [Anaerobium acetethylicum]|uniref:Putative transcriptional regulator n=1 Tax=Anaerobium acetethylicum TaxID=1619234 RepID=A0A1D3TUX4_9FIRM|nr:helix-turn-helix transcriptional regulator [Anaerobium acetethylicum]SCP97898.1 putative transcriptional regulator [Anaerobium acetethylicum]